jgi:phosphoserine phosphatase
VDRLIELHVRVLCDPQPGRPVEVAYLFGQSPDNAAAVFDTAEELLQRGEARSLLVCGGEARSGYDGADAWRQELSRRCADAQVEVVPFPAETLLHTKSEAEALVDHLLRTGRRELLIVASAVHQVRAFATTVSVIVRHDAPLRAWSRPARADDWTAPSRHSQGEAAERRSGWIAREVERIHRYVAQGDLLAPQEILAWLDRRDAVDSRPRSRP